MKKPVFDELIYRGELTNAARIFAKEYYESGKMGHTRKLLIEQLADKVDRFEQGWISVNERLPDCDKRYGEVLNKLRDEIHQNAIDHGWWDEKRTFGDIIALCHSELSEALEEYRNGMPMKYNKCKELLQEDDPKDRICEPIDCDQCCEGCPDFIDKPEGIAIELADCIIRILDFCGHAGIDIDEAIKIKHEYNKTRSYKHGGKVI